MDPPHWMTVRFKGELRSKIIFWYVVKSNTLIIAAHSVFSDSAPLKSYNPLTGRRELAWKGNYRIAVSWALLYETTRYAVKCVLYKMICSREIQKIEYMQIFSVIFWRISWRNVAECNAKHLHIFNFLNLSTAYHFTQHVFRTTSQRNVWSRKEVLG